MPTQFITGTFTGDSLATLQRVIFPKFLSGDLVGDADTSVVTLKAVKPFRGDLEGDNVVTLGRTSGVSFVIADDTLEEVADSSVYLGKIWHPVLLAEGDNLSALVSIGELVLLEGVLEGEALVTLGHLGVGTVHLILAAEGEAGSLVSFRALLPVVRDAEPGEVPGAVNLVANSSLEHPIRLLQDWSAGAGITLSISSAEATHGTNSAKAVVASGSGSPVVTIKTVQGLEQYGAHSWVGSVDVLGGDGPVDAWLVLYYTDGTSETGTNAATLWEPTALGAQCTAAYLSTSLEALDLAPVAIWESDTGSDVAAEQYDPAQQPLLSLTGGARVAFTGTEWLDAPLDLSNRDQTVYALLRRTSLGAVVVGSNGDNSFEIDSAGHVEYHPTSATLAAETTATVGTTSPAIVGWHITSAAGVLGINGVEETDANATGAAISPGVTIGNGLHGDLYALLVFQPGLSAADRDRVEGWLAHAFGQTALLDAGHPYKTTAPTMPVVSGTPQRLETPSTPQNPAKVLERIELKVSLTRGATSRDVYLDAAQVEEDKGRGATPFIDPDLEAASTWSGMVGYSPAVRQPVPEV